MAVALRAASTMTVDVIARLDMKRIILGWSMAAVLVAAWPAARMIASADAPLALKSGKVTLAGTSNIHEYTASTTDVRVVRMQLGDGVTATDLRENPLKPGAIQGFEIAISAMTLKSGKDGLDKNMWKALKAAECPDITFKLTRFDVSGKPAGAAKAIGLLRIAGVEREVALDITAKPGDGTLSVQGHLDLLMTDYGIKPVVAMMGMLKTDPKVTITFETVLTVPLT
jgi:polyisoprenoid-binding protein YceI